MLKQRLRMPEPKPVKSFLRWAGSKRRLFPILERYFVDRSATYVEPFAGSSAIFFQLAPKNSILADLNSQLTNTLRVVRDNPDKLSVALSRMPRHEDYFYQVRKRFNDREQTNFRRAVNFIYLNRNCFNGLWRTDTKGRFNVPFGGQASGANPARSTFRACAALLRNTQIRTGDFRNTLKAALGPSNFVYLDPPYFAADKRVFVEYGKKTFGADDLNDLLEYLRILDKSGASFVFTYRDDAYVRKMCKTWEIRTHLAMRNVGGFKSTRRTQNEIIVSNTVPIEADWV